MRRFPITTLVLLMLLTVNARSLVRLTTDVVGSLPIANGGWGSTQPSAGQVFGRDWNAGTGAPGFFTPSPFSFSTFPDLSTGRIAFIVATGTTTTNYGDTFAAAGTATNVAASSTLPSYAQWKSTTTNGNVANVTGNANYVVGRSIIFTEHMASDTTVNRRDWWSLSDQSAATMGASDTPAGNYAGVHYCNDGASANCASDLTNYEFCTKDNTTINCVDTGVAADTAFHVWGVIENPGVNFTLYEFTGGAWVSRAVSSSNLPTTGTALAYRRTTTCATCTPTGQSLQLARMYVKTTF